VSAQTRVTAEYLAFIEYAEAQCTVSVTQVTVREMEPDCCKETLITHKRSQVQANKGVEVES
jgi:hypothetical protein